LEPHFDARGSFARAFSADDFAAMGLAGTVSQINLAHSRRTGTIRGIHWQSEPFGEAKLVRCVQGRIFDVCVDVREGSPTLGRWVGVELSADNGLAVYVPPGCGHAHQTLEDDTRVLYTTSAPYEPGAERGARWDDPALSIAWPVTEGVILSEKDRAWPNLSIS
jgi:dTDP-4-dehydrorhamnose 3,5-epimerase